MNKLLRNTLRLVVLLITAGVFGFYVRRHPELLEQLLRTPPIVITILVLLYLAWFGALALTVHATLRMCRCSLPPGENLLLNAYSVLVNFFVPGQGGVAVRGLYLKRRYGLAVRRYILATLIYYTSLATFSAMMMLVPGLPWWQTAFGVTLVVTGSMVIVGFYQRRFETGAKALDLRPGTLGFLVLATGIQAAVQVAIYAYELKSVNPDVSLSHAVSYTGAANFSIFAALTPGAIGIRESFLIFSRQLHHVPTATIVAASVIDRAVFFLLLALLFLFTLVFHAKDSLQIE